MLIALLLAANALPVEVVGFSPDDRYVAFIEHGVAEGSGFPWARLRVIDVARNADATAPVEVQLDSGKETDTEDAAVKRARAAAESARGKLRVASWVPARTVQAEENGELTKPSGAPIGTVQIEERVAKGKSSCEEPFRPLMLRLALYFLGDDKPARLAEEKKPPKDRACATSCTLAGVFAHGKAALMLARCGVQGSEGPATKFSAYAGTLPYALE